MDETKRRVNGLPGTRSGVPRERLGAAGRERGSDTRASTEIRHAAGEEVEAAAAPPDGDETHSKSTSGFWLDGLAILALVFGLGLLACIYNGLYYQQGEPFYDSMSYHEKVHRLMQLTAGEGLERSFQEIFSGSNTVLLPMLAAAVAGLVWEPSRLIGIWIQVAELLVFLLVANELIQNCFGFARRYRRVIIASFAVIACLHFTNGGLSDFRMDLGLALFYGAAGLKYLVALRRGRRRDYVWLGVLLAAACLSRATAPIYLVLGLGPIAIVRWIAVPGDRANDLRGLLVAGGVAALLSGWFYILNFDHLHYYYFVWNTDANAKLPWSEALGHLKMVERQLGWGFWLLATTVLMGGVFRGAATAESIHATQVCDRGTAGFGGALVWLGIAPLVLLIGKRMGLNPFVSMPSAILLHLAAMLLLARFLSAPSQKSQRTDALGGQALFWLAVSLGLGAAVTRGYLKHAYPREGLMQEHRQILETIVADANRIGRRAVHYGTAQIRDFDTSSLQSVVLFDMPRAEHQGLVTRIDGVHLMPSRTLNPPAEANWRGIPGETDREKVEALAIRALEEIDYLVVPTEQTAAQIEETTYDIVVEQHLVALREALAVDRNDTRHWTRLDVRFAGKQGREYELWRADSADRPE